MSLKINLTLSCLEDEGVMVTTADLIGGEFKAKQTFVFKKNDSKLVYTKEIETQYNKATCLLGIMDPWKKGRAVSVNTKGNYKNVKVTVEPIEQDTSKLAIQFEALEVGEHHSTDKNGDTTIEISEPSFGHRHKQKK